MSKSVAIILAWIVVSFAWFPDAHAGTEEGTYFSSGVTNTSPSPSAFGTVVRIAGGSKCVATETAPTYVEGEEVALSCKLNGDLRTTAGSGGGGDASLAEQQTQTGLLTTIDADTGNIATNTSNTAARVGDTADAACTAGSTGSLACKLRLMTSQLDAIQTSIQTLDDAIESTRLRTTLYDSGGNEIVVPTAGLTHNIVSTASTNCTSVEASSGTVYHYSLSNTTTTVYYLRMYNLATAPTASSATGFVESIPIPPASAAGQVGGRERPMNIGQAFTTGIAYCITGGASSTDNTNAAAGVYGSILYKP